MLVAYATFHSRLGESGVSRFAGVRRITGLLARDQDMGIGIDIDYRYRCSVTINGQKLPSKVKILSFTSIDMLLAEQEGDLR